eukprot:CAMPEP_0204571604 /NCGR_PEP_ID=MMETSP0661-20131031/38986_1 /ASSEMBLY_ACC=CAM_ASM_000606 /TAXON_ID=109239 /ORGANISM="Alexandrium margalefi, Strain AMGDE01CS-322" /LENGTH=138 /DNA_ID=CAMNT_0051579879 /DNA_START=19 /DNA_END=435 /DNA_ORIENTATION=+
MASGIAVADEVVEIFNGMKIGHKTQFAIFKINDSKDTIVTDAQGAPGASYDEFIAHFKADNCRYGLFDVEYEKDGGKRNKLVFFTWCSDQCSIKEKMIYSSSKDALKKKFNGLGAEVQATSPDEIDFDEVLSKFAKSA